MLFNLNEISLQNSDKCMDFDAFVTLFENNLIGCALCKRIEKTVANGRNMISYHIADSNMNIHKMTIDIFDNAEYSYGCLLLSNKLLVRFNKMHITKCIDLLSDCDYMIMRIDTSLSKNRDINK